MRTRPEIGTRLRRRAGPAAGGWQARGAPGVGGCAAPGSPAGVPAFPGVSGSGGDCLVSRGDAPAERLRRRPER